MFASPPLRHERSSFTLGPTIPARFVKVGLSTRVARLLIVLTAFVVGCSTYQGTAKTAKPHELARRDSWTMVTNFPLVMQKDRNDCGAAALASVLRFWGRPASPESVEAAIGRKDRRLRAGDMADHAKAQGLRAYVFFGSMDDVVYELEQGRPVIVGLGKAVSSDRALSHYEVVVGYEPEKKLVLLLDPARGWQIDTLLGFSKEWARSKGVTIVTFLPDSDPRLTAK